MKTKWLIWLGCVGMLTATLTAMDQSHRPVKFTAEGIQAFLKNVYNAPNYGSEILPHNFCHLIQFLKHGEKNKQSRTYTKSVFRLFNNKLKASRGVNSLAFSDLISDLPRLLEYQFMIYKVDRFDRVKQAINDILYNSFLQQYDLFEENPTALFDEISTEIVENIKGDLYLFDDVSMDDLRRMVIVFLELGINKLLWSPDDGVDTWKSAKGISDQLAELMEYNIITDPDDLNDLYISLIERYCHFLELTEQYIPTEVYVAIKMDIEQNPCLLLDLEEQEEIIESKANRLLRTLLTGEARARSREYEPKTV